MIDPFSGSSRCYFNIMQTLKSCRLNKINVILTQISINISKLCIYRLILEDYKNLLHSLLFFIIFIKYYINKNQIPFSIGWKRDSQRFY